jgi:1-acyl-sn-glycerol-3-phosphate acyltransferase
MIAKILRTAFGWTWGVLSTVVFTLAAVVISPIPGIALVRQRLAKTWGRFCVWGSGCRVRTIGLDHIDTQGRFVVMVNHQSALDIPLLMAVMPARWRTVFWAKQSLFRIPVLGMAMRLLGHMPIDRVDRSTAGRMLADSAERAADSRSVLVFPEETYSPDGELLPFQRGGFVLALKIGLPILPVGVHGTREALGPHKRLIEPGPLTVRFGSPMETASLGISDRQELMDRTRAAIEELRAGSSKEP